MFYLKKQRTLFLFKEFKAKYTNMVLKEPAVIYDILLLFTFNCMLNLEINTSLPISKEECFYFVSI